MNEKLIEDLQEKFELRATDDLFAIWNADNRDEWSDETFEAIRRVLCSRGQDLFPKVSTSNINDQIESLPTGPRNNDYVCLHCYVSSLQERPLPRSFLFGYGKFKCPQCGKKSRYPLNKLHKIFYWLLIVAVTIFAIAMFTQGYLMLPSVWFILAVFALVDNAVCQGSCHLKVFI